MLSLPTSLSSSSSSLSAMAYKSDLLFSPPLPSMDFLAMPDFCQLPELGHLHLFDDCLSPHQDDQHQLPLENAIDSISGTEFLMDFGLSILTDFTTHNGLDTIIEEERDLKSDVTPSTVPQSVVVDEKEELREEETILLCLNNDEVLPNGGEMKSVDSESMDHLMSTSNLGGWSDGQQSGSSLLSSPITPSSEGSPSFVAESSGACKVNELISTIVMLDEEEEKKENVGSNCNVIAPSNDLSSAGESIEMLSRQQLSQTQMPPRLQLSPPQMLTHLQLSPRLSFNSTHHPHPHHDLGSMMQRSRSSNALGQLSIFSHSCVTPEDAALSPSSRQGMEPLTHYAQLCPLDFQGGSCINIIRPANSNMRRVYSTGDIQTLNGVMISQGGTSPISREQLSLDEGSVRIGHYTLEERRVRVNKYRQKRSERNYNKKIKYACRKTLADSRLRIRGRFARTDESVEGNMTEERIFAPNNTMSNMWGTEQRGFQ